jgi:hypothetical protein
MKIVKAVLVAVVWELVQSVTKPGVVSAAEQSAEVHRLYISRYFPEDPSEAPRVNRTTPNPFKTLSLYTGLFASKGCFKASTCFVFPPNTDCNKVKSDFHKPVTRILIFDDPANLLV